MSTTTTPPTYHLCSYEVRTGEQEYVVYELHQDMTEQQYTRDLMDFCLQTRGESLSQQEFEERIKDIEKNRFSEWAYDDRIYQDPCVQDVTEAEYRVLKKYLQCR